MRDRSKRGFEFFNEIERRQRANAETMFGVDAVERDLSNAGEDCGVEIGLGALLHLKRVGLNVWAETTAGAACAPYITGAVKDGRARKPRLLGRMFSGRNSQSASSATR